jgi:DNA-binding MarR family transcriptional regulator
MTSESPNPFPIGALADDSAHNRVGRAWKELRRGAAMGVLRDHLFGSGADALEPGQVDTLELLVARDAWRMSELAEALRVDPSTATRAVQRLVKAGMASRTTSVDDARVVMVSATPAGRARAKRISELRRETLIAMLRKFSEDEREQFAEYMERFVATLDEFVRQLDRHG